MDDDARTGGCLCGGVRYRATGPFRPLDYCHCTDCRRSGGGPLPHTAVALDRFDLLADESLRWFTAPSSETRGERGFCVVCGASLFFRIPADPNMFLLAGSLDDETGLVLHGHIFWDSRAPWELADGLPTFARYDDGPHEA
jgi:hypothetical protein